MLLPTVATNATIYKLQRYSVGTDCMVFSWLELCAGATVTSIGKAAAEEAAWAKLQRSAVWWLGEHANAAAMEYAGDQEAVKATAGINAALQKTTIPGEIIALQVSNVLCCAVPCWVVLLVCVSVP